MATLNRASNVVSLLFASLIARLIIFFTLRPLQSEPQDKVCFLLLPPSRYPYIPPRGLGPVDRASTHKRKMLQKIQRCLVQCNADSFYDARTLLVQRSLSGSEQVHGIRMANAASITQGSSEPSHRLAPSLRQHNVQCRCGLLLSIDWHVMLRVIPN